VSSLGQQGVHNPNIPRPPNLGLTPPEAMPHEHQHERENALDNELFIDANDHSSMRSFDSDMEIVEETPRLKQ
ncbi:hypothetical protein A2U01_0034086, partial [Trifolium medium]|nr:hypothetical protein [Trifolium medium]